MADITAHTLPSGDGEEDCYIDGGGYLEEGFRGGML